MAGLTLDLFQHLGVRNVGGIGVALDAPQEPLHRPLECSLIHVERDPASAGPRLAEFRIAMTGETLFGGRKGACGEARKHPSEEDGRKKKYAAARALPPYCAHARGC
jgi:hypothetical protein